MRLHGLEEGEDELSNERSEDGDEMRGRRRDKIMPRSVCGGMFRDVCHFSAFCEVQLDVSPKRYLSEC